MELPKGPKQALGKRGYLGTCLIELYPTKKERQEMITTVKTYPVAVSQETLSRIVHLRRRVTYKRLGVT